MLTATELSLPSKQRNSRYKKAPKQTTPGPKEVEVDRKTLEKTLPEAFAPGNVHFGQAIFSR